VVVTTLSLTASGPTAGEAELEYPPTVSLEDVRGLIDGAPKQHPRLLASGPDRAALRATRQDDPTRKALAKAVIAQAAALQEVAPITRQQVGRRLLGQSRRCVKRVLLLATAYHLTGDIRYARRCEREMLAAASFHDWNPSHFLDVAEMTFALAIGYDWLYPQLDEESREAIRAAIVHKGVALQFESGHTGWVASTHNWGQVCHGGLAVGALAVMEDEPQLAALESALGTDFGLSRAPGFDETGQFLALATGPSGLFFNYADGGATREAQPALHWFAAGHRRPDWLLGEHARLRATLSRLTPEDAATGGGRLLPLALLWMGETPGDREVRMPLHWSSGGATPVTVHRSSWTDPGATYVGLKGGSPSAPATSRWRTIDTATPRNEWDSANPGTSMVAFEVVAPESGAVRLAVLLTPGSAGPRKHGLELRALDAW
jgi:hypothetical protein